MALLAGCTAPGRPVSPVPSPLAVVVPASSGQRVASQVQVIAHPDDDLYFMAPDLDRFIRQGRRSTTVVLTAGEFNGFGELTREQYASQRQEGLRAAYADMAGVSDVWTRTIATVAGKYVERDTLVGRPQVSLVFLNLPDGKDSMPGRPNALEHLWQGATGAVLTVVPAGSMVPNVQAYTATDLTAVLAGLFATANVSVARLMDSHPDHRLRADHSDHIHAGLFAERALRAYALEHPGTSVTWLPYRGYGAADLAANLDPTTAAEKRGILGSYTDYDPRSGLADVGFARTERMYPRYLAPALRAAHQSDGRLTFAAVVSGTVRLWTRTGERWQVAEVIGGGQLAPPLAVALDHAGRLHLFALRLDDFHLVTATQTEPNVDAFTGWVDLGNHNPIHPREIGSPEAIVDVDGWLHVFVKNFAGGVSTRNLSPAGVWSRWESIGGTDVVDSVCAALDGNGEVELYAPTSQGILRWTPQARGRPPGLAPDALNYPTTGAVTVVPNADGRLQLFYREAPTATVSTIWQLPGGGWGGPVALGGDPGVGPVAAAVSSSRIVLAARTRAYDIGELHQIDGNRPFGTEWADLSGQVANQPALGSDETGRMVIAVVGEDGFLRVRSQLLPGAASPYAEWISVG